MRFENTYLPAGGYWSSPFSKWQGSFSTLHPVKFAADVTSQALAARNVDPADLDSLATEGALGSPPRRAHAAVIDGDRIGALL